MEEVWKDVVGYEGLYKVSNFGNVYSNYIKRSLKPGTHWDGYKAVILYKNKKKKYAFVHRLVAEAFIPNPDNLPLVNHKDEITCNNHVSNLEWCDASYNNTYNDVNIRIAKKISKHVYGYDSFGNLVHEYYGAREAARSLHLNDGYICDCCNGNILVYKDIIWSYKKLDKETVLNRFEEYEKSKIKRCNQRNNTTLSKPVRQKDLDGNIICEHPSAKEAERQLGFSSSLIAMVCRSELKQTHGFVFEYI